jgi:type IV secretory pathway VirJ component
MKSLIWLLIFVAGMAHAAAGETLSFGPFGELILRGQTANPESVAIVLSDAGGWGDVEEEMAKVAGDTGALVIGVDLRRYFAHVEKKKYEPNVSHELSSASKYVQKTLALPRLSPAFLIGHGAGAGVVYASLVQAPENVFLGGFSLGFRPVLPVSQPFGWGRGLVWKRAGEYIAYDAVTKYDLSWTVVQAERDPLLSESGARDFVRGMRGVTLHGLPGIRDYADATAWREPLRESLETMVSARSAIAPEHHLDLEDLPLIEVPSAGPDTDCLAVFVTGDGGWAGIDKDIAAILADSGLGVVGLDSLRYFWTRRTPEGGGADLARIMRHYLSAWGKSQVIFIGYSLGADALPPMIASLPEDLRRKVRQVTLLAPSKSVELEFHVTNWLHDDEVAQDIALLPEIRKLEPLPMLCVYGQKEKSSLCTELRPDQATIISLPGGHHFDGDYARVAALILEHLQLH